MFVDPTLKLPANVPPAADKSPENVALPELFILMLFPMEIPEESTNILVVDPSFNLNSVLLIEICSVAVAPIVVVVP